MALDFLNRIRAKQAKKEAGYISDQYTDIAFETVETARGVLSNDKGQSDLICVPVRRNTRTHIPSLGYKKLHRVQQCTEMLDESFLAWRVQTRPAYYGRKITLEPIGE